MRWGLRAVDVIFCVVRNGCIWANLPKGFPPYQSVCSTTIVSDVVRGCGKPSRYSLFHSVPEHMARILPHFPLFQCTLPLVSPVRAVWGSSDNE